MPLLAHLVKFADRLTHSRSTRTAINLLLHRYGTMTHLTIDPKAKSIDLDLQLLGEESPIHIHIDHYDFQKLPTGDGRITLTGLTVSRPWLQELAKNFAEDTPLLVPSDMAKYLSMVL